MAATCKPGLRKEKDKIHLDSRTMAPKVCEEDGSHCLLEGILEIVESL